MPELLLELFSEEIPARMQARAAADLERIMNERLFAAGFMPEGVKAFAGPRRLTLVATGLPARQSDRTEEKKGPRVGAPAAAIDGFLKSAGLASIDACEVRDDKKGAYYIARVTQKGRDTADVIAEITPAVLREFPWPKSMRWGDGSLRWVRPLKRILCCFNDEVVPFEIDGLVAGDVTEGHRVLAPGPIHARNFERYAPALTSARVLLDGAARAELIAADAKTLCEAQGLELVEDKGLLAELAGLAEWPVVMMGAFDPKFLELPDEALSASMRGHQKYFSVRDPKAGRLAAKFVYVANLEAEDSGRSMRAGYERVLTARLSDAWYLYHQDLKRRLEDRVADLDRVTFFEGLGSIGDKARRVAALAREIAPKVGANPAEAESAALLAKADLTTGMVYEFPELQGLMGRYYALKQEVTENIADAIRDHYLPKGADDDAPSAPVSVAVALADKLDTLAAFFAIDKKPTGSSDPFALRRAALGTIAVTIAGNVRIKLGDIFAFCAATFFDQANNQEMDLEFRNFEGYFGRVTDFNPDEIDDIYLTALRNLDSNGKLEIERARVYASYHRSIGTELIAFFHDRLKVYLKDRGHRHDRIDAVLRRADGEAEDDIALIVMKLKALNAFLDSDDGANLAAGYKRAANILKAEEKKGAAAGAVDAALLQQAEEKALFAALGSAEARADEAARAERFADAMAALAALRAPIDAFFDKVTVNAEEASLRANRLALLRRFVTATARVADLSKLEG